MREPLTRTIEQECRLFLSFVQEYDEKGHPTITYWRAIASRYERQGIGTDPFSPLQAIRTALKRFDDTLVPDYVRVVEEKHDG